MKKTLVIILILSVALNILLVAAIANQSFGIPIAEAIKNIKTPGTYGPPAMEIIDGDASISTNEVMLQNTLITGNLHLTGEVNQGTVTLQQVEVQGEVIIAGGNFTLNLSDCTLAKVSLQAGSGAVKIVARGATSVANVAAAAEASLQEDSLAEGAHGFKNVQVAAANKVILLGGFENVDLAAKGAKVKFLKGTAVSMKIKDSAPESVLELAGDVLVESLSVDAVASITGEGKIESIDINAPGLVVLQGELGEVVCRAEGIFLELQAGNAAKIVVTELEHATSITLAEDTAVESMELNGRTGVTGKGTIGNVTINHAGVTIDQMPGKIIMPENLTAIIAGEEYKAEPEPEPEPQPKPEPPKPSVQINKLSDISLLMVGGSASKTITVQPSGVALSVSSSNTKVATVSLSGKTVTVTGKGSGTVTITVKGTKSGYTSGTRTFKVTVKALTDVKSFVVKNGLSPGKKLVLITLYADNPSNYTVSVAGVKLAYQAGDKTFYGEVLEADAKLSNVKVSN